MGIVNATLKITNPLDISKVFEGEFLVDTGAQYTVVPKSAWQKLGLKPDRKQKFSLADGKIISRPIRFRLSPIVLGGSRDDYLLGVVTLENLGFSINPFTRELYPAKLIM